MAEPLAEGVGFGDEPASDRGVDSGLEVCRDPSQGPPQRGEEPRISLQIREEAPEPLPTARGKRALCVVRPVDTPTRALAHLAGLDETALEAPDQRTEPRQHWPGKDPRGNLARRAWDELGASDVRLDAIADPAQHSPDRRPSEARPDQEPCGNPASGGGEQGHRADAIAGHELEPHAGAARSRLGPHMEALKLGSVRGEERLYPTLGISCVNVRRAKRERAAMVFRREERRREDSPLPEGRGTP